MRPSLFHARKVRAWVATVAAAGAVSVAVFALTGGLTLTRPPTAPAAPTGPAPWDFTLPEWDLALGGDVALTAPAYTALAKSVDPSLQDQDPAVRALARDVATADLTGQGRGPLSALTPASVTAYWPEPSRTATPAAAQCTNVELLAVAPAALPVSGSDALTLGMFSKYSKSLVAFTGTCGTDTFTLEYPGIRYVYAGFTGTGWVPLRYWQLPADAAFDTLGGATEPYEWELKQLTTCAGSTLVRDRIAVVEAFTQMCAEAAKSGVQLEVTAGYRTRGEQASLFSDAVKAYGSEDAARRRVAYADDRACTSRHCSGLALNVTDDSAATAWLNQTVGCVAGDGTVTTAGSCPSDQAPVPNLARWGFAAPLQTSPGYLEFTLALGADSSSSLGAANCAPTGVAVANQVASIFRCRLAREGIVGPAQELVVAQALTVSRCESGWNAAAAAFGGRFAQAKNPVNGKLYTQRGVFMLGQDQAAAGWVVGSLDALADSVANINGAASLWIATRGWEQFGCATGDAGGFEAGPVLELFGGPPLPAWAAQY